VLSSLQKVWKVALVMTLFKKAKQITLPKNITNTKSWLSDEDIDRFFTGLEEKGELTYKDSLKLSELYLYLYDTYGQEAVDYVKSIDASARTIEKMIKRGRIY